MDFKIKHLIIIAVLLQFVACSNKATISDAGIASASIGGVAGGFIGNHRLKDPIMGTAIGAAAGTLTGLVAGEYLEKQRVEQIRASSDPKRLPSIEKTSREKAIEDSWLETERETKLGAGETKPWNERYLDNDSHLPYQGH